MKEDQSRAEWVRFERYSAWQTKILKARSVKVNQGLNLDWRLESLVMTEACLSSREDIVL